GRGTGVVVETGLNTEIGKISKAVTSMEKVKPPLIKRMEKFSFYISIVVLVASALIALIEFSRGASIVEVFFVAVALAVSSIPEGLPAALTVALSVGMARMAKKNVIIRKLSAVEGLGSCTLIASDKTGTLTVNKQTVKILYLPDGSRFNVTGEGYNDEGKIIPCKDHRSLSFVDDLVKSVIICNEAHLAKKDGTWVTHGDAVDIALLALGYKNGMGPDKVNGSIEILSEIPFESDRKYSAKFYRDGSQIRVATKGAYEVISSFCAGIDKNRVEKQAQALARTGHRVIAVAEGEITSKHNHVYYEEDIKGLHFLGLVGLIDPLRPEAKAAVDTCKQAGIKVIMITGDHPETAFTIGKNLGIASSRNDVIEGALLSKINEKNREFVNIINNKTVFARVAPMQKLYIVDALAKSGNFIAVTGDGVNDAPALKKAHISVAMGSGTDVAKDVSSMIVVDDNFASIVAGVEEGRYAYDNIRKVVYLLVSCGAAEIVLFLLAVLFNTTLPLVAVQLLWLNLVTNGIQGVGLAFEKGEKEAMHRPPRSPEEGVFNELLIKETLLSGLNMGITAFIFWITLLSQGIGEYSARNMVLLLMVLFENIHVFNCRSEYKSAFKVPLSNNILLIAGIIAAQILHIVSMNISIMQDLLDVEPIGLNDWLYTLVLAGSILIVMEIFKILKRS
ncbi:MAG: ATPase, partial [Candidatus Melainabacteria bacterium GWF2_37_15]